ncbi:hypothetical protein [Methanoregula sp.]|uniref:hypothetical protein n=1 Tax=Methanoregula sp. TaxID=2052170 RepID=UPI00261C1362|nr:hypothetical protein [Methanoregula sp.]MDD5142163.1 hypothetical protein [Methanoregula sp.]
MKREYTMRHMAAENRDLYRIIQIGTLLVFCMFLSQIIAVPASAGIPPPEYRAGYMLPRPESLNASIRGDFIVTREPVPEFPDLSKYHAYQNILYTKTGDHYVTEVWYFTEGKEFSDQSARITSYLASHGEISNTSLCLFSNGSNSSADIVVHTIPAIGYRSNTTSGYLVTLPGYMYIIYYGRTGIDRPDDNSSVQSDLITSALHSEFLVWQFEGLPPSPPGQPDKVLPNVISILAVILCLVLGGIVISEYILPRLGIR